MLRKLRRRFKIVEKYLCSLQTENPQSFFERFYVVDSDEIAHLDNFTAHVGDCTVQLVTSSSSQIIIYARGETQAEVARSSLERIFDVEISPEGWGSR